MKRKLLLFVSIFLLLTLVVSPLMAGCAKITSIPAKLAPAPTPSPTPFPATPPKTFQIDFKNPDGTEYGDYNTPQTWDDVKLVAWNFEERARTSYLNPCPKYPEKGEPAFLEVVKRSMPELVEKIEARVKEVNPEDPDAILKVAKIVQEEVLDFEPRYEELFGLSFFCVPKSIFIYMLLNKELREMGLRGQVFWAHSIWEIYAAGHMDVLLYDQDKHQFYVIHTYSKEKGIEKWEESIYNQTGTESWTEERYQIYLRAKETGCGGEKLKPEDIYPQKIEVVKRLETGGARADRDLLYTHILEYNEMKLLENRCRTRKLLLQTFLSGLDYESSLIARRSVTMDDECAISLANYFLANGFNQKLFEQARKIVSVYESGLIPCTGKPIDRPGVGELVISGSIENPVYQIVDSETWLEIACDYDPVDIDWVKRKGCPIY